MKSPKFMFLLGLSLLGLLYSCKDKSSKDSLGNVEESSLLSYQNYLDVAYGMEAPYELYSYLLKGLDQSQKERICNQSIKHPNIKYFSISLSIDNDSIMYDCSIKYLPFPEREMEFIIHAFNNKKFRIKSIYQKYPNEKIDNLYFRMDINKLCFCEHDNK